MATYTINTNEIRGQDLMIKKKHPNTQVRINWAHPFSVDLKVYLIATSFGVIDLVDGTRESSQSSTMRTGGYGLSRDLTSGGYVYMPTSTRYNLPTGTDFWSMYIRVDVDSLANYTQFINHMDSGGVNGWDWRLGTAATDSKQVFVKQNSAYKAWGSSTNMLTAGSCVAGDFGVISYGNNLAYAPVFYSPEASEITGADVGGTGTGTVTESTEVVRIGQREDTVTDMSGSFYVYAKWNRNIQGLGWQKFRSDPYQILIPA